LYEFIVRCHATLLHFEIHHCDPKTTLVRPSQFPALHERMIAEEGMDRLSQGPGSLAMDDSNPGQASSHSSIQVSVESIQCFFHMQAAEMDLRLHARNRRDGDQRCKGLTDLLPSRPDAAHARLRLTHAELADTYLDLLALRMDRHDISLESERRQLHPVTDRDLRNPLLP
jgi:hypothetical protein